MRRRNRADLAEGQVGSELAMAPSAAEYMDRRDAVTPIFVGVVLRAPGAQIGYVTVQVDTKTGVARIVEGYDVSTPDDADTGDCIVESRRQRIISFAHAHAEVVALESRATIEAGP